MAPLSTHLSRRGLPTRSRPQGENLMEPLISIRLDRPQRAYQVGETIHCQYQVDRVELSQLQAVEASLLWYTEGKGEEDLGVHYFQRNIPTADEPDIRALRQFQAMLPGSPLSYEGIIIKIQWCARVRVFLQDGTTYTQDQAFLLGKTPVAQIVQP